MRLSFSLRVLRFCCSAKPEGEGVLLGVHHVSVLAPLPVQLLVVHLWELGAQGPPGVGVVAAAHQVQTARAVAAGLPPQRDLEK